MSIAPPSNFSYNDTNETLNWDGVVGAVEYEILFKPDDPLANWEIAYSGGAATECSFKKKPGKYKSKGRSSNQGGWGDYGIEETVEIE